VIATTASLRITGAAIVVPVAVVLLLGAAAVAGAADYAVVINSANTVTGLDRRAVSALFLRRVSQWEGGTAVLPVDGPNSSAREAFSKEVHGRKASAVRSHWLQVIFSGRGVPPPEKASDQEVIEYVKTHPGAIGYVSSEAAMADVRVLKVTP
jgi:ABC-type phosphate transport system substrate-binding protein